MNSASRWRCKSQIKSFLSFHITYTSCMRRRVLPPPPTAQSKLCMKVGRFENILYLFLMARYCLGKCRTFKKLQRFVTEFLNWTKKLIPLHGELIFPHKYSNKLLICSPHTVYRKVSILFIFKHDFRWRIDFGPNRPWKGFAWASTHLHVPRCNLSFLPPSIREVGKEKNVYPRAKQHRIGVLDTRMTSV